MRYTWPKFKLCRREQTNIYWSEKYNIKKRRTLPWQHGSNMQRHSEYGKLLRNKQLLKRLYWLSEKQFSNIVIKTAAKFSKNNPISHDEALFQFLESRADSMVYRSWIAKTITQARQMVTHWHFLLNGKKHNIPSSFLKQWDILTLKEKLNNSSLYTQQVWSKEGSIKVPSWIKVDKNKHQIEILNNPRLWEISVPADIIKVIEYYARD
jgi:small subunit ribosomal protein S4